MQTTEEQEAVSVDFMNVDLDKHPEDKPVVVKAVRLLHIAGKPIKVPIEGGVRMYVHHADVHLVKESFPAAIIGVRKGYEPRFDPIPLAKGTS